MANAMDNHLFAEWERVIIALDYQKICGYCTVAKTDCIPDLSYTSYIGYLFVGEEYRGNRLSQKLIQYAMDYLKSIVSYAIQAGMNIVIPPKKNRKNPRNYDPYLYKIRHLVENAFLWLKC